MEIALDRSTGDVVDDPVARTARTVFKVPALYPYQRLVVANILDAHVSFEPSPPPLGITAFMPEAEAVYERVSEGAVEVDSRSRQLVILPTGAGKSLCFQLPATLLPGVTVVIYPLVSLMEDQARRLRDLDIPCQVLRGGGSPQDREKALKQVERGLVRIILTNPETLAREAVLQRIARLPVSHLVVDEAHCIVEWGQTFRPAYLELARCARAIGPRVTTAFTATASPTILDGVRDALFPDGCHLIQGNPDRSNIAYHVVPVLSRNRALSLLLDAPQESEVESAYPTGETAADVFHTSRGVAVPHLPKWAYPQPARRPALVFCRSRVGAELTAAYLRRRTNSGAVYFYHAGLSREEKTAIEQWFYDSSDGVLVATVAYGMGVDKKNIRTVIHMDPPASLESYLQESGRAGRDGNPADGILLAHGAGGPAQRILGSDGEDLGGGGAGQVLAGREQMVAEYAGSSRCRRAHLLSAMGWESEEVCFGCDVCFGTRLADPAELKRCLRFLRRNRRRFRSSEIAALLTGGYRENDWLPNRHPVLAGWQPDEAREALLSLAEKERIRIVRRGPWKGRVDVC